MIKWIFLAIILTACSVCTIIEKTERKIKIAVHKAKYRHSQWYYYIIPKRLTGPYAPAIYKWLWWVIRI